MTYAFTFDASACTGCKACQIACKDKNDLPVGVIWRRNYEVTGGSWEQQTGAWMTDVFAYNISVACNHCVHPKCAGVCPTDAYVVRDDGVVYIDSSRCMGCGYCVWACPYAAPQYHPGLRQMTKCDFCRDYLDAGLPPACVAACPMRVLNYVEIGGQSAEKDGAQVDERQRKLWELPGREHPFPLPAYSRTEPHLAIKPHVAMANGLQKTLSNREEIHTRRENAGVEALPLVAFTLLVQMAVGAFWYLELIRANLFGSWGFFGAHSSFEGQVPVGSGSAALLPMLSIGFILALAGLISLLHLGTPRNGWKALGHLRKSWLSREIMWYGLFTGGWGLTAFWQGMGVGFPRELAGWVATAFGILLIYSMANVYRLRASPTWNTWRTPVGFFITSILSGCTFAILMLSVSLLGGFLPWSASRSFAASGLGAILLLGVELLILASDPGQRGLPANRVRLILIVAGVLGWGWLLLFPGEMSAWMTFLIFLVVLAEETIGRWHFYTSRTSSM